MNVNFIFITPTLSEETYRISLNWLIPHDAAGINSLSFSHASSYNYSRFLIAEEIIH
ncbi:MAG: hypothetical protein ACTSVI_07060 [Promethearchaeota archaeon]